MYVDLMRRFPAYSLKKLRKESTELIRYLKIIELGGGDTDGQRD